MLRRQSVTDLLPRLPEIRRLVNERRAIVHQVKIDSDVSGAWIEVRRIDFPHRAPLRHTLNVLRDVGPFPAAVARVPDLSVVGAGPDETALNFGRSDREHELAIEL